MQHLSREVEKAKLVARGTSSERTQILLDNNNNITSHEGSVTIGKNDQFFNDSRAISFSDLSRPSI